MKTVFQIAVGHDENTGTYSVLAHSMSDGQVARIDGPDLRQVIAKIGKTLQKKVSQIKNFPLPEESRIITPNGNGGPKLSIVTP